ncbi:hypothetical protein CAPTEDRAFT_172998 [Capitella teleta]|uniref:Dehydrogenase/reductase SDR family member 11 n=1 Tax=Capitella teleta TaxID=283909 RepID=R7V6D7_CAPTE|nr:hypothetical protein CAPTEDRAFT_172998 [Capitella teleta]|eukprot:ELU14032.1 hypothetical protein CAPTEDRAFT_172998 [Capitella teleta]
MDRWVGRVAMVTGGSGGIGRALVKKFVQSGLKVLTCGRSVDKLKTLEVECEGMTGKLVTIRCDMQNEADIAEMFTKLRSEFGRLDILVNNAGVGSDSASMLSGETSDWREMLETNVLAVAICTREGVKLMRECDINDGHIINIGSMSGHRIAGKSGHFYSITKFALKEMTEGLRRELRETKNQTRVTLISPGYVSTGFHDYSLGKDNETRDRMRKLKTVPDIQQLETDDIVDAVVYAVGAPPHVQIHDILMRPTEQVV